jgi:hypothetical protein
MPVRVTYNGDFAGHIRNTLLLSPQCRKQIDWLNKNVGKAKMNVNDWGFNNFNGHVATTTLPIEGKGWRMNIHFPDGDNTSFVYKVFLIIDDDMHAIKFKLMNEFGWNEKNYEPS